jgi:hypothetical protein
MAMAVTQTPLMEKPYFIQNAVSMESSGGRDNRHGATGAARCERSEYGIKRHTVFEDHRKILL